MKQTTVDIRVLKSRLTDYLRLVRAGESIEIVELGLPIARIVPVSAPALTHSDAAARAVPMEWNRGRLPPAQPVTRAQGSRTVADLLVEDRT